MAIVRHNRRARTISLPRVPYIEQTVLHAAVLALALSVVLISAIG
jgi:hypothetical protein